MTVKSDHQLERLVFFSDAVFAIAITLLIIEVKVPHLEYGLSVADTWRTLADRLPSIGGFVLSFLVIGRFWIGHHSALAAVGHHDTKLLWPNLFLLMSVAFLPFATAFMSENIYNPTAIAFYNMALLITSVLSLWVIWLATDAKNAARDVPNSIRSTLRLRGISVVLGIVLTFIFSLFIQGWAQLLLLTIPVFNIALRRIKGIQA